MLIEQTKRSRRSQIMHSELVQSFEQPQKNLGRGERVTPGAMAVENRYREMFGNGVEPVVH